MIESSVPADIILTKLGQWACAIELKRKTVLYNGEKVDLLP